MARNSIIDDVTDCRMQILQFFFFFQRNHSCGGWAGGTLVTSLGWPVGHLQTGLVSNRGATHKTRTALLFRAHQPRRGFLLSPLSSNGIALTHRRDRRDAPKDLLSSPHIYHHRDRNR